MKRIAIILMCLICFILGACMPMVADAEQTWPLKIWKHNDNGMYTTLCVVDEVTGVNYIVVSGELHGSPIGAAITPRLNADGSLYITD